MMNCFRCKVILGIGRESVTVDENESYCTKCAAELIENLRIELVRAKKRRKQD